jgi:hypothetical protein
VKKGDELALLYHSVGAELYTEKNEFKIAYDHLCEAELQKTTPPELTLIRMKKDRLLRYLEEG